jgi:hypothetical protein
MSSRFEILILRAFFLVLRDAASRRLLRMREKADPKGEDFRTRQRCGVE